MHSRGEWDRQIWEEERKLLREITEDKGPLNWRKFGKMIQLNAMLRRHNHNHRNYF